MAESQTYATHRRYLPLYHFFAVPILSLNVLVQIVFAVRHFSVWAAWNIVVAMALIALAVTVRQMATRAQDRIIRLEETLRLERLLPPDLRARIGELSASQLVALRFCSDQELPELTRAVLDEKIHRREDIKRRIRSWRPDTLRV